MSADDVDPKEEEFASLMAAWDEALSAAEKGDGTLEARSPVSAFDITGKPNTPTEFSPRLERDLACAQLVRAVLRPAWRSGDVGGPPGSPGSEPAPVPRLPWTTLGRFELRRELGRGGFGMVFLAHDPLLGREVAVKVPHVDVVLSPELRDRFLREARAASGLDHPNLVPVFEVGEVGPVCFLVSAYCPGISLARWLKENIEPVSFREAAQLVATLAGALDHAHSRGVIHRDLKPTNVLLQIAECGLRIETQQESAAHQSAICNLQSAIPKITDFGLAKQLGTTAGNGPECPTRTGAIVGTPSYMAPEQAGGKNRGIGPAVDIYALGAILYELLTRRPPFQGESDIETLLLVQTDEPVSPARLRPRVPRDLETICLKCLHKDPARRYARAGDLADDLDRFLHGAPVKARSVGRAEYLWRWCRRKPLLAGLLACVAGLLAAVVAVAAVAYIETRAAWNREALAAEDARGQRRIALDQRDVAQRHLYFAHMYQAEQAWKRGELGRVLELLEPYRPTDGQLDYRGWEWHYLRSRCRMLRLRGHHGMVRTIAWSPDGESLASGGFDRTVRIWNAQTGAEAITLRQHTGAVICVAWSPDGTRLATGSADRTVCLWDVARGKTLRVLPGATGTIHGVAWNPDGQRLAYACDGTEIRICRGSDGELLKTVSTSGARVLSLAWCPDGRHLAAGTDKGKVLIWDLLGNEPPRTLGSQEGRIFSIAWSPDGKRLASVGNSMTGMIWRPPSGRGLQTGPQPRGSEPIALVGHLGTIWSVAWSPNGQQLATASADGSTRIWDPAVGKEVQTVRGHTGAVMSFAWSPDGRRLASAGTDETIAVVSATPPEDGRTLTGHRAPVWGLSWSPDGRRLASASEDRRARIWDPSGVRKIIDLLGHETYVTAVDWSPDGRSVATAAYDGKVKIWDADTGQEQATLPAHQNPVRSVCWRPDGKWVATGGDDGTVRLWDVRTRSPVRTLVKAEGGNNIRNLAWSPDGRRLAVAGADQTVQLWDAPTGQHLATLRGHHASVAAVVWSPDGGQLASASFDGTVKVWDAGTCALVRTLRGYAGGVCCLAWSPTGRLASGAIEIKIWDPTCGAEALTLKGHTSVVQALAWSPDGKRLASGSWDHTIKIWDASRSYQAGEALPP